MAEPLAALAELVDGRVLGDRAVVIGDVTHDSREAGPGTMFVAVRGFSFDGHDFIDGAIASGAAAICVEAEVDAAIPQLVVPDTRSALAPLAAMVHGNPSRGLDVIGITGTNGKTTVAHMLETMLASAGRVAGLIGTIETRIAGTRVPAVRTTPEASDFQRLLAEMLRRGVGVVACEVSSHALELGRVDATHFRCAAFTNLSQDHLDFHGTSLRYRQAKERLFLDMDVEQAVINIDDPTGAEIASRTSAPVLTVGASGEVAATDVSASRSGSEFTLVTPQRSARARIRLAGAFNVSNALVAAGCGLSVGLTIDEIITGLGKLNGVPGRFEVISNDDGVTVIIDYAHTPEGITEAVNAARALADGRVIAVIGAGGDRDREKRPLMGEAGAGADLLIVTSDNPRSESPEEIADSIESGIPAAAAWQRVLDRRSAIAVAIGSAGSGDVVLILGKGHEQGQLVGARLLPFDDRRVAREELAARRESANYGRDSGSMTQ